MSALYAVTPLGLVERWSTRSQEQARRNAMAACTVLTARRIERTEVAEFVTDFLARFHQAAPAPAVAPAAAPRSQVG